ncbi:hypothetical protein CEXT_286281 [Caerostris extrusa]|uniref:Uncharacterized protein n=1 Tax=Caerostris extrusa TaxID=172846 RepID=A0AAV4N6C0_CAEEX|nr:hypothetical protein CEXT_286281 [Caerostris extrusa]
MEYQRQAIPHYAPSRTSVGFQRNPRTSSAAAPHTPRTSSAAAPHTPPVSFLISVVQWKRTAAKRIDEEMVFYVRKDICEANC